MTQFLRDLAELLKCGIRACKEKMMWWRWRYDYKWERKKLVINRALWLVWLDAMPMSWLLMMIVMIETDFTKIIGSLV